MKTRIINKAWVIDIDEKTINIFHSRIPNNEYIYNLPKEVNFIKVEDTCPEYIEVVFTDDTYYLCKFEESGIHFIIDYYDPDDEFKDVIGLYEVEYEIN